jgi:magnesium-transporting ATPase (P-type)
MDNNLKWYQLSVDGVFKKLESNNDGLTSVEAAERLKKYGPNELKSQKPSVLRRFFRQFNNPLVYVLLVAAAITGGLTLRGEHMLPDTAVILGVVILNVILDLSRRETEAAP